MDPVIVTRALTKRFGGKSAVDHLNLAVPPGSIFALLGDNVAGKSTTIRMLTRLLPPDGGSCRILGEDCWAAAERLRHQVGYVPEKPRFYDWMTVAEIGWFTAGFHREGFLQRYLERIESFGLQPGARLKDLSKGGYAKVGLALALAPDPEVLILDEPTSGLDLLTRKEFLASMVELAGAGRTIFISSHAVAELERVAIHVAFLSAGRLLLTAPLDELRGRFLRLRFRLEGAGPDLASLGKVLERRQAGRQWEVVIQDPAAGGLDTFRNRAEVLDLEEGSLNLEEVYGALLGRLRGSGAEEPARNGHGAAREEETASRGDEKEGR